MAEKVKVRVKQPGCFQDGRELEVGEIVDMEKDVFEANVTDESKANKFEDIEAAKKKAEQDAAAAKAAAAAAKK